MSARVCEVIVSDDRSEGDGKTEVYRRVIKIYSLDGELLGKFDPTGDLAESSQFSAWSNVLHGDAA